MANVYVYSGAAGAGTGADWTNAYTTLAAAFAAKAAGDDFWVAHDHAESTAGALNWALPGTAASPNRVICALRTGSTPPVSADLRTTATAAISTASNMNVTGFAYWYGITFNIGSGATSNSYSNGSAATGLVYDACTIALVGNDSSSTLTFGPNNSNVAGKVELRNTILSFAATGQTVRIRQCDFCWVNTPSAIGGTVPTTLFSGGSGVFQGEVFVAGVDLSAAGSGKTLVGAINSPTRYLFQDCKLGASVTVSATPLSQGGSEVFLTRCDSGDTNYRHERYRYEGTQTVETTVVRTGGASDGTTPIAWKIITTANSKRYLPFESRPISIWNETTGSAVTLTVQGIWGGGAVPTNADIWMDVEYLGTSGVPLGSFATSGPADQLASGTNLSAGSGTWGGSTTKFALEKTITPQEKGPITVYIRAALASSTFYIDPFIIVS